MSCLFNSISAHLGVPNLRQRVIEFIESNSDMEIEGTPIREWLTWAAEDIAKVHADQKPQSLGKRGDLLEANEKAAQDPKKTMQDYLEYLRHGHWGGGPEMAILAHMFDVNIQVEQEGKIISTFGAPQATKTIEVSYSGNHYEPERRRPRSHIYKPRHSPSRRVLPTPHSEPPRRLHRRPASHHTQPESRVPHTSRLLSTCKKKNLTPPNYPTYLSRPSTHPTPPTHLPLVPHVDSGISSDLYFPMLLGITVGAALIYNSLND